MSQVHSDNAFRSKRPNAKDLSAPHLRALRKELLIVRADVERMELAQATIELRHTVTHFSWLKFLVPGFGASPFGGLGSFGRRRGAAGGIGALLKEYPLISSIASLVLAKPIRSSVIATAKPMFKWGSVGLAAWEAFRIYQQIKREHAGSPAAAADAPSTGAQNPDMTPP
jgi:hypothetical protein